jgi:hypothetical protein
VKLPSVEQVEKIFNKVRYILWNFLELVLLMIAMIGFAGQALRDVPAIREWLDQRPLKAPAPPSGPPDYATPPTKAPESQPEDNRRKPEPVPIVQVAAQQGRMVLPVINRVSVEAVLDIDAPAPLDVPRTEYANPIIPFEPERPKPRHNAAIRAITAPVRGIEAIARKIRTAFRDDKSNNSGWVAAEQQ